LKKKQLERCGEGFLACPPQVGRAAGLPSRKQRPQGKAVSAPQSRKHGFTLVELMVATLAAAILLLIVGLLLTLPIRTMRTNDEYAALRRDMAFAMQMIAKDVRESSSNTNNYVFGEDTLSLPALPAPSTVRPYAVNYGKTNNVLTRTADGAAAVLLNDGVRRFWSGTTNYVDGEGSIIVRLELENPAGDIIIQHVAPIHTRN